MLTEDLASVYYQYKEENGQKAKAESQSLKPKIDALRKNFDMVCAAFDCIVHQDPEEGSAKRKLDVIMERLLNIKSMLNERIDPSDFRYISYQNRLSEYEVTFASLMNTLTIQIDDFKNEVLESIENGLQNAMEVARENQELKVLLKREKEEVMHQQQSYNYSVTEKNTILATCRKLGLLGNVYLGLYIGEKQQRTSLCGLRVMICNQVFVNLLALYSHAFLPAHNERLQESGASLGYLCKIMPSLGFLSVAVSLSNLACICVVYYYNKKSSLVLSRRNAWLIVINLWFIGALLTAPLAISLNSVRIEFNNTSAEMCAIVWQNKHYEETYMDYVFIFKFLVPLLVIFTICLKIELLSARRMKWFPNFPTLPAVLMNILAATCLLLLVYLYPLHSACATKGSPFVRELSSTTAFGIVRTLELIGLANCSIVPAVLISCIDEYSKAVDLGDGERENDYLAALGKDDAKCLLVLPSPNVSSVTYEVLTENVVADESRSNLKSKDVKILINL